MARTTTYHSIVIESAHLNGPVIREAIADEAITPGYLLRFDSDEELENHAAAGGVLVGKLVAVESQTPDIDTYPTYAAIDIPYAATVLAYYIEARPGDILNMLLANGETDVKGVTQLISNGDGTLKAETVDGDTIAGSIVGVAEQDVTASGATRCRVRIT